MSRTVSVAGVGMTQFRGESEASIDELMGTAATAALTDADREPSAVGSVHVGNMAAESFNRRSGLANALVASLGADGASADRVENTSASGASAFLRGYEAVASGQTDAALVVGVEKMSAVDNATSTDIIGRLVHESEWKQGVTLPSFAGLAADAYLRRHDAPRDALTAVAMKNHANGTRNPYAQFQRHVSATDVTESPLVADPLRLYDCCPTGDGAAAVVLTSGSDAAVTVAGTASATGTHAVGERSDLLDLRSVRRAGRRVYRRADCSPERVDVAAVHDAFTVLELLELEELGFFDTGTAWRRTLDGETQLDGALPVNPGGGLKARGHPLGATGTAQLVELTWQLRSEAQGRQVARPTTGLALNVAGFGNNSICTILEA